MVTKMRVRSSSSLALSGWPGRTTAGANSTHSKRGKSPTHFSYEWSPWREESQAALRLGLLPEIHVWVGLPDQNELLDFSTKFLPQQSAKDGLAWRTAPPPDFLWCGPSELPAGVISKPDLGAIGFILNRIEHKA